VSLYELKQDNHRYKSKPKQEDPSPSWRHDRFEKDRKLFLRIDRWDRPGFQFSSLSRKKRSKQ
jgi:hypothetical protein